MNTLLKLLYLTAFSALALAGSVLLMIRTDSPFAQEPEPVAWCGTMNLPENKVLRIEHPGKYLFTENCSSCHSIRKDWAIVGPSLCGSTQRITDRNFQILLYHDPETKLKRTAFYKKANQRHRMSYHATYKFDFDETMKSHLKAFLDTITVVQEQ